MDKFLSSYITWRKANNSPTYCAYKRNLTLLVEDTELAIQRRSQLLGICPFTMGKILGYDLVLHPLKVQLVQERKLWDQSFRWEFANWALKQLEVDSYFYRWRGSLLAQWVCLQAKFLVMEWCKTTQDLCDSITYTKVWYGSHS